MSIFQTPDSRFTDLPDFPFAPHYATVSFDGTPLRMHYLDEGSGAAGTALMLHGMPTWSFVYRRMIASLVAAGWRCVVPDHIGFGKSDKVLEDSWYSIERHSQAMTALITQLDLHGLTLFCQDWGGPIGLRQVADMPDRFDRLAVLNTWLHHEGYEYTPNIRNWNRNWHEGGFLLERQAVGFVMQNFLTVFPRGSTPLTPEGAFDAYEAPFPGAASKAGPRRFPLSIPFDNPEGGNATVQQRCWDDLLGWKKPVHFLWGVADLVFTEAWGREWAANFPQATFDPFEGGHFLQETHGPEVVEVFLRRVAEE